jgi:hypothetical protein
MTNRTLYRRVPGQPWQPPVERVASDEGTITATSRRDSVTVKLNRCWAVMLGEGDRDEFREAFALMLSTWKHIDFFSKCAVIAAMLYLALEMLPAFLPGGSVWNLCGGLW